MQTMETVTGKTPLKEVKKDGKLKEFKQSILKAWKK
jgi:hypothetical protein